MTPQKLLLNLRSSLRVHFCRHHAVKASKRYRKINNKYIYQMNEKAEKEKLTVSDSDQNYVSRFPITV
jgi:hypothetical protein